MPLRKWPTYTAQWFFSFMKLLSFFMIPLLLTRIDLQIIEVWYQITRSSFVKNTFFWSRISEDLTGSLSVVSLDAKYTMTEINVVDIRRAIRLFLQWTSTILKRINRIPIRTPHQISTVPSSSTTRLDLTSVHYRRLAPHHLSSSSYIIQILFREILSDWNVQKSTGTWLTSK